MRLYHSWRVAPKKYTRYIIGLCQVSRIGLVILLLLSGCVAPRVTQAQITVNITVDGQKDQVLIPAGSTAQAALIAAKVNLNPLDRSDPPFYTVLTDGANVRLIRVREEFKVEQVVIPYEHQVLRNESMPEGETRLSQPGVNGIQENTYRIVYENGVEILRSPVKSVVVKEAVPEIMMVGSQAPFTPIQIPGRLAYLQGGNAWVMEKTTGNRRPVVNSGDLDGRIFFLSPDGTWLLYTRRSTKEGTINSLWVTKVNDDSGMTIDLQAANVVHFAAFAPDSITIAYSTVEPRSIAPGWQANNDLVTVTIGISGFTSRPIVKLDPNSGGVYGWWGTNFAWAPDGNRMAYSRPDGVGILEFGKSDLIPLLNITPLQTGSDWAWVPGLTWGPDGKELYTVDHVPQQGASSPEVSPLFDLTAVPLEGGAPIRLVSQVGMFAYPVPSPVQHLDSDEDAYQVAFLQAIFPTQSETSNYRLNVMDRDGSNQRVLFPPEGAPGLKPQQVAWSPLVADGKNTRMIAVIYQDNIWLVNATDGQAYQITGDGLTHRVDWK